MPRWRVEIIGKKAEYLGSVEAEIEHFDPDVGLE